MYVLSKLIQKLNRTQHADVSDAKLSFYLNFSKLGSNFDT